MALKRIHFIRIITHYAGRDPSFLSFTYDKTIYLFACVSVTVL